MRPTWIISNKRDCVEKRVLNKILASTSSCAQLSMGFNESLRRGSNWLFDNLKWQYKLDKQKQNQLVGSNFV